jgi:hypothetical protein
VFLGTHVKDGEDLGLLTDVWVAIVENYSNRALTDDRDRLPALAGVAGEFQRATRDEYVAGMWKGSLIRQLGWKSHSGTSKQFQVDPAIYQPPSWSWTSRESAVSFDNIKTAKAELLSWIPTQSSQQDSLTKLQGCKLEILAKIVQASRVVRRSEIQCTMDYKGIERGQIDEHTHWLLLGLKSRGNSVGLVIQGMPTGDFVKVGHIMVPEGSNVWGHSDANLQRVTLR